MSIAPTFPITSFSSRTIPPQVLVVPALGQEKPALVASSKGRRAEAAVSVRLLNASRRLPRRQRSLMTGMGAAMATFLMLGVPDLTAGPMSAARLTQQTLGTAVPPAAHTVFVAGTDQAAISETSGIPHGASSIQESYQDWLLVCSQDDAGEEPGVRQCAINQQQISKETEQRVLAVEFRRMGPSWMVTLALPFGLSLQPGVRLQFDERAPNGPYPFQTCLPSGCLVQFELDEGQVETLQAGKLLKLLAVAAGGKDTLFNVPLGGFAEASERLASLQQQ
ncbi:MAG: invasion associated locus B family protein [Rhizobium sp.]|nr:invasion associated locus B family protein [Rhizobium sp.]